jgi:hypothetical protein
MVDERRGWNRRQVPEHTRRRNSDRSGEKRAPKGEGQGGYFDIGGGGSGDVDQAKEKHRINAGETSDRLGRGRGGGRKEGLGSGGWDLGNPWEEWETRITGMGMGMNGDGDKLNRVRKSKRDQICQDRKWRIS